MELPIIRFLFSCFMQLNEHGSGRNSGVECNLAKVDVEGSNPFARSSFSPPNNAIH